MSLPHIGFKVIMTFIGISSFLNLRDINHGQDVQIRLQQETNRLLQEIKAKK
jgi:hypothetical protein